MKHTARLRSFCYRDTENEFDRYREGYRARFTIRVLLLHACVPLINYYRCIIIIDKINLTFYSLINTMYIPKSKKCLGITFSVNEKRF